MFLSKIVSLLATGIVSMLLMSEAVQAQRKSEPRLPVSQPASFIVDPPVLRLDSLRPTQTDDVALTMVGVAGAGIGTLGGAYLGYQLDYNGFDWGCEDGCEDPGVYGLVGGWFVGSALLTPLAVHLANHGRGSLSTAYLSSALIAGAGMAGLLGAGSPEGAFILLGAPLAQVISAVLIERRTTR